MTEKRTRRTALVTGASSGVGAATAAALGAEGFHVYLLGRNLERLSEVGEEISKRGGERTILALDLLDPEGPAEAADRVSRDSDRLDLLFHGAGTFVRGAIEEVPADRMDEQYRIHVRAPYVLTRLLLPRLEAAGGDVIFVNSTVALHAPAGVGAYAAAKQGMKALAESLRNEVNESGIRVTTIYLGRTATPMQEEVVRLEGRPYRPERLIQPADVASVVLAAVNLPRTAEITDITIRPARKPT